MNIKFRYASFLLVILAFLIACCLAAIWLVSRKYYLLAAGFFLLLYLVMFLAGRRFAGIFLTLSFLKFLKQNGGSVSVETYSIFIDSALGTRKGYAEREKLKKDILNALINDEVITNSGDRITFLHI